MALNNTNETINPPAMITWVRLFGASSYAILSITSLAMNLMLLFVFIKGHKEFKTMSFFVIAWQMVILDITAIVAIQLILAVPTIFADHALYPDWFTRYVATLDTMTYNGLLFFCFLMTLNRFLVFMWPSMNERLFVGSRIYVIVICFWLITICHTIGMCYIGCFKTYNAQRFYIMYECTEYKTIFAQIIHQFNFITSSYLPPFLFILYVMIFLEIKFNITYVIRTCSKNQTTVKTTSKKEINILYQCTLIVLVFELENLSFKLIPSIPVSNELKPFTSFVLTWTNLLLNTIDAIVIFSFNSMVRSKLREIFGWKKSNVVKSLQDSNMVHGRNNRIYGVARNFVS